MSFECCGEGTISAAWCSEKDRPEILTSRDRIGLTLSPTALLPPPYPTALGLIGPSKKDDIWRKKPVLMTSPRSDQSWGRRLRAIDIAASPPPLPQGFQLE
jgi:hypothetical protein